MRGDSENKRIAVRSDSIIEARFSLTARQNNIIDMLLSEINNDEQTTYELCVDKYKDLYHMDTSNIYRDLMKAVKSFEKKGFTIIDKDTGHEVYYAWFSRIEYIPREGKIKVNIDKDLKKLFYEVKKQIYYDIEYPLNFSSTYSQRVYYYLKSFEDTKWRKDRVDVLIEKLECPSSYQNFANLKKYVLEVAKSEINASSDLLFDYETEKTGKKVTHITFKINNKKELKNPIVNELALDQDTGDKLTYDFINGISQYNFDLQETTDIITAASKYFDESSKFDDIRSFYKENFKLVCEYHEKGDKGIPLIKLVISSLKNNWAERNQSNYKKTSVTQPKGKQLKFTDYDQRQYDYDNLEDKLLSWMDEYRVGS